MKPYTLIHDYTTGKDTAFNDLPEYVKEEEIELQPNAEKVLRKRYLRKGLDGKPVESIAGMFYRISHVVANNEGEEVTKKFYELTSSLRFLPNTPTFTGAGTPLGQLAACFVLPVKDDMGRESDGIFSTLRNAALIQQSGGGIGFSFSRIRPKDAVISRSKGKATGPIGFMETYDKAFDVISQGGARRSANMGVMRVDHPDIRQFITSKSVEGHIPNFNISVAITDDFMSALEQGKDYPLINPQDNTIVKWESAKEIFDLIVEYAHRNGEPGVLFIDEANRKNPVPHLYTLEATNP